MRRNLQPFPVAHLYLMDFWWFRCRNIKRISDQSLKMACDHVIAFQPTVPSLFWEQVRFTRDDWGHVLKHDWDEIKQIKLFFLLLRWCFFRPLVKSHQYGKLSLVFFILVHLLSFCLNFLFWGGGVGVGGREWCWCFYTNQLQSFFGGLGIGILFQTYCNVRDSR